MPFHSIIAAPEALVAISAAFDNAWFNINALTSIDPLSASAARERLGRITIGLWKADPQQDIAKAAVHLFFAEPDIVSAPLADPT